jgi:putative polyhydroxyalkanoate system protein
VKADEVHVTAELGMLLSAMKGTIEQEIRRKLDEHFA